MPEITEHAPHPVPTIRPVIHAVTSWSKLYVGRDPVSVYTGTTTKPSIPDQIARTGSSSMYFPLLNVPRNALVTWAVEVGCRKDYLRVDRCTVVEERGRSAGKLPGGHYSCMAMKHQHAVLQAAKQTQCKRRVRNGAADGVGATSPCLKSVELMAPVKGLQKSSSVLIFRSDTGDCMTIWVNVTPVRAVTDPSEVEEPQARFGASASRQEFTPFTVAEPLEGRDSPDRSPSFLTLKFRK